MDGNAHQVQCGFGGAVACCSDLWDLCSALHPKMNAPSREEIEAQMKRGVWEMNSSADSWSTIARKWWKLGIWAVEWEGKIEHKRRHQFCRAIVGSWYCLMDGGMVGAEMRQRVHDLQTSSHRAVEQRSSWAEDYA